MRATVILVLAVVMTACAVQQGPLLPPAAEPFAGLWRHPDDPRLLAWVSSPWSFSTTSYAHEGDDGLVLFDTQFLADDAAAFVDAVESATGKKAKLAVVLHANPDKFNGTATLQARGIRVVTSAQVKALLPAVHEKRTKAFAERYGPAYPRALPEPEASFDHDVTIDDVAGASVHLLPVGPGCSDAHVLAVVDGAAGRHVFAGDLVANGSHLWLELGHISGWRARLDELDTLVRLDDGRRAFVHPGRGLSGDRALIDSARAYLTTVETAVRAAASKAEAKKAIVAATPGLRFAVFVDIGLAAVWRAYGKP